MDHLVRADMDEEIYPGFCVARFSVRLYRKRNWWLAYGDIGAIDYLENKGGEDGEIPWYAESGKPLEIFEWRIQKGWRHLPPAVWFDDAGIAPFTAHHGVNEAIRYFIGRRLAEQAQAITALGIFTKIAEKFRQTLFCP